MSNLTLRTWDNSFDLDVKDNDSRKRVILSQVYSYLQFMLSSSNQIKIKKEFGH